jgi:hypothetical protein
MKVLQVIYENALSFFVLIMCNTKLISKFFGLFAVNILIKVAIHLEKVKSLISETHLYIDLTMPILE